LSATAPLAKRHLPDSLQSVFDRPRFVDEVDGRSIYATDDNGARFIFGHGLVTYVECREDGSMRSFVFRGRHPIAGARRWGE
jgi:hypothetical protein